MYFTKMRPTFELELPYSTEEVMRRIATELKRPGRACKCLLFSQYAELHIPESQVRYWSPHLSLSFEPSGAATRVHGRFAPRNEVWTFVWICYLLLAFSGFFAAVFEFANRALGQSTWFGVGAFGAMMGICAIYMTSQIGQRLSADQMQMLKSDWQQAIEHAFPPETNAYSG